MITMTRILGSVFIAGLIAGCSDIQTSSTAAPGPQPANPSEAGRLFAKGCLQTQPNFARIKTALSGEPFTIHPSFGTFYHTQQNLSIKVVDSTNGKYCSIVFGTPITGPRVAQSFSAGIASVGVFDASIQYIPPRPTSNGLALHSARTNAQ